MRTTCINSLLILLVTLISCVNEDPAFIAPEAAFSLSNDKLEVFEIFQLTNQGKGQFYSVFTGDAGHQYVRKDSGDTGFKTDINGNFSYSYSQAGTYTLTYVVSGYKLESGERIEEIAERTIEVNDPDIVRINLEGFEVVNSALNNNKFLDPVTFLFKDYRKTADTIDQINQKIAISYYQPSRLGEIKGGGFRAFQNPSDINIIPDIRLNITSKTVKVRIEGIDNFESGQTLVVHDTEDDLRFQEKTYEVVNLQGQVKPYTVCPMIIPEFTSFELEGATATPQLSAGDYNTFFVNIDLPDGTDLTNLLPTWTLYDPEYTQVFVNGEEIISGGIRFDFSRSIRFTLLYTQPKGPEDNYEGTFVSRSEILVSVE